MILRQAQDERETFAARAARLAGLVARLLGWRPDHFWNATPAELAAIFAVDEPSGGSPLTRAELTALLEQDRHG
jgi:hypothetical protein